MEVFSSGLVTCLLWLLRISRSFGLRERIFADVGADPKERGFSTFGNVDLLVASSGLLVGRKGEGLKGFYDGRLVISIVKSQGTWQECDEGF